MTNIILSVISGALVFVINELIKEIKYLRNKKKTDEETKDKAIIEAIVCLMRIKLIEYHDRYVAEGHIPSYAYENWSKMFTLYTTLGGNGLIVGMNEDIEKLPIV